MLSFRCEETDAQFLNCFLLYTCRLQFIAVGDLMFLGMQDFDFAQISPKTNFLGEAATVAASPASSALTALLQ